MQAFRAHRGWQALATYTALQKQIAELSSSVNAAEDKIFVSFCRKINLTNIREYEERQLKVAQEESEARLRFDNQIARLTHQYVVRRGPSVFSHPFTGPSSKERH